MKKATITFEFYPAHYQGVDAKSPEDLQKLVLEMITGDADFPPDSDFKITVTEIDPI